MGRMKRSSSSKPSKQRKRLYNASYHRRQKLMSAALSTELREKYNTRSFPVRVGDKVVVARGDYTLQEGKIMKVNRSKYRIQVEGVNRKKADGTEIPALISPSKVVITDLDLSDPERKEALEERAGA